MRSLGKEVRIIYAASPTVISQPTLFRISFNLTLLLTGTFALAAGGAPNPVALCSLIATWNLGVGGNLPVDSAVFLEFVPASHQWLLTVLSVWWAVGQLVASLVSRKHLKVLKKAHHSFDSDRVAFHRELYMFFCNGLH